MGSFFNLNLPFFNLSIGKGGGCHGHHGPHRPGPAPHGPHHSPCCHGPHHPGPAPHGPFAPRPWF